MITLRNLTLRRGPRVLLEDATWTIFPQQRIGLVGANGSGKSSFFALLLAELVADKGDFEVQPNLRLSHVAQETPAYAQSALDFVLDGDSSLRQLQLQVARASVKNEGERLAQLHAELEKIDAYTANARAAQLLAGLGFRQDEHRRSVSSFSGGWRMRLNLAKALMSPSDLLLLDEPTNHLDLDAILWLEQWLSQYSGTLLLISHDREFLDNTVQHIAELSQQKLKIYSGNYSTFEKQRAAQLLQQQAVFEKQQRQLAHMQSFVDRFRAKATKSRQAQSRLKAIERMELVSAVSEETAFHFQFKEPGASPNPMLRLEGASLNYGEKSILQKINLSITPGSRIAFLGPNGAGKSSLIKLLAGEVALSTGNRLAAPGLKIGYFAQHQVDHLRAEQSPLEHLRQLSPEASEQSLRSFLGGFGFNGSRVLEPIRNFSGGEKSRLALALITWQKPNLLLLDEPTNHLDMEIRQALYLALQDYQGALILVSHDRFLIRTSVDQLYLVADQGLESFAGDLNEYQSWLVKYKRQKEKEENTSMSHLLSLDKICLAYGLDRLLDEAKFQISTGERVCLIGRNGAGKSSLMKIIEGSLKADSGMVYREPHLRLARLEQELPQHCESTVYEFVAQGLADLGKLLADYHELTHSLAHDSSQSQLLKLEKLQQAMDAKNAWSFEQRIESILTRLKLPADQKVSSLSGGWQRRAALARALVTDPQLLLLDEPTNHLDIEAIEWLENELLASNLAIIFITHDRALLQRLATRIVELDRGQLTSWPGDYQNFLRRKEEMLAAEATANAEFDKKLAQEEVWIRQGIKARRTRNEGRVRALEALRVERSERREVQGKANFSLNEVKQSGQLVVEAEHLSERFPNRTLIDNFSMRIMRGDRIGLIGPNGVGKTTLLNLLLGKKQPQEGKIIQGTRLDIVYFDQLRRALDPEKTIAENVVQGSDFIDINGRRMHIISYLADFLFTPARARTPVKALSGGECNRLLLAQLFSRPANLMVLDEPTNDLDIETLELLEELLGNYQGTMLLVSHDRAFLDNVVTSTLIFEGQGVIKEYVGGYKTWQEQIKGGASTKGSTGSSDKAVTDKPKSTRKLSYKEQKELADLPALIEKLETEQQQLEEETGKPEFYQKDPKEVAKALDKLKEIIQSLEKAYQRWDELESK